jgi:hypothetical protein
MFNIMIAKIMFVCPIVNIDFWVAHIDPIVIKKELWFEIGHEILCSPKQK